MRFPAWPGWVGNATTFISVNGHRSSERRKAAKAQLAYT